MITSEHLLGASPEITQILQPVVDVPVLLRRCQEKQADIPGRTGLEDDDGQLTIAVRSHTDTLKKIKEDYCDTTFTPEQFTTFYKAVSLANYASRETVARLDIEKIGEVHRTLNSADELSHKIYDAGETGRLSEEHVQYLLLSLREDWVAANLARLNALRFSVGLISVTGICDDTTVHAFGERSTTLLDDTLRTGRRQYDAVVESFGEHSPLMKAKLFAATIPILQLGGTFPLSTRDTEQFAAQLVS